MHYQPQTNLRFRFMWLTTKILFTWKVKMFTLYILFLWCLRGSSMPIGFCWKWGVDFMALWHSKKNLRQFWRVGFPFHMQRDRYNSVLFMTANNQTLFTIDAGILWFYWCLHLAGNYLTWCGRIPLASR